MYTEKLDSTLDAREVGASGGISYILSQKALPHLRKLLKVKLYMKHCSSLNKVILSCWLFGDVPWEGPYTVNDDQLSLRVDSLLPESRFLGVSVRGLHIQSVLNFDQNDEKKVSSSIV